MHHTRTDKKHVLQWLDAGKAGHDGARVHALVKGDDVEIYVIAEGSGMPIVLLPSRGRDSEDYDDVAARLARAGYRVLRPQPRGVGRSTGPMTSLTLHDLAGDIALVIRAMSDEPAVVVGHAFGNWVARMTATDYPDLVRGVVIAAAAAKQFPAVLSEYVNKSADMSLRAAERLHYLRITFFASGNDPTAWLQGWYPRVSESQRLAGQATMQAEWWAGGSAPMLDLQAEADPFKPADKRNELKEEFGSRISVALVANASHALLTEQPAAVATAIDEWISTL